MQLTESTLQAIMTQLIAAAAILDKAANYIGLFVGINDKGNGTLMADLTKAPGTLATAVALGTWGTPYLLKDGTPVVDQPRAVFTPASAADDCVATGYYLSTAASGGNLVAFGYLPQPVHVTYPSNPMTLVLRLCVPDVPQWGIEVEWGS